MTARCASPTRDARDCSVQFSVQFVDGDRARCLTWSRHLIRSTLQQFIHGRRDAVALSERDDLSIEIVRLDVARASEHALPR